MHACTGHGRMLRDHLVSTYVLLKQWGNPDFVCKAGMFHALCEWATLPAWHACSSPL